MIDSKNENNRWEARTFILSALFASVVLILGDQAIITIWSPTFFTSIGEWIWNLFVSISFLWAIVTLYGLVGGACWQATAVHLDPFGRIANMLKSGRKAPHKDRSHAAGLGGIIVALGLYLVAIYAAQLHFSVAYQNKPLAAFLFIVIIIALLPGAVAVYNATQKLLWFLTGGLERWFPKRVLIAEIAVLLLGAGVFGVLLIQANRYLFEIIDIRPWVLVGIFLIVHLSLYCSLAQPVGREIVISLSHMITVGGWLIIMAIMLCFTILAYPSQPRVASILLNQTVLARPIILAIQRLTDNDGDGFSPLLRGGDCDDSNPLVHPMAQDIPDNGIDEDCLGGDAPVVKCERVDRDEDLELRITSLQKRYNILLISIDAVRADHVGYHGYHRATTPEIDAFAGESIVFTRAYAQAPNTPQSIPSIMTGMYPTQIHWQKYINFPKILSRTETVMDGLKEFGYHVAGIFSYWYFERRNLKRKADHWDLRAFRTRGHAERYSTDDLVTDYAIEHLEGIEDLDRPLFMWLHYFDPHFLYTRHEGISFGKSQMDLYDAEIRFSSEQVGRFLDYYRRTPFYENSVIILTADHGEEFEEHGRKYHGGQIYEESIHVPLIIHAPNLAPQTITEPVGLIDIVPTIYNLVGVDLSGKKLQGRSLLPLMLEGRSRRPRPVYIEKLKVPTFPWSMQALISDRWKLLHRANEQLFELYDLKTDPGEKRSLYDLLPEKAAEMRLMLGEFRRKHLTHDTGWYRMAAKR